MFEILKALLNGYAFFFFLNELADIAWLWKKLHDPQVRSASELDPLWIKIV